MKKSLHVLCMGMALIIGNDCVSQTTLTATGINPVVGDEYIVNTANYLSPGNSGANQTWDLSAMTSTGSNSYTFVTPSSTPYASSFPNANISFSSNAGDFGYYKTLSSAWQFYGVVAISINVIMSYADPEDLLRFPFSYTNTYLDTWAVTYVSGGLTYYRKGTTTVTSDGYGTVITPAGTYSNVMRIHFIQDYQDSTYDSSSGDTIIYDYYNDEYFWYSNGIHFPVAYVFTVTGDIVFNQASGFLGTTTGINESDVFTSFKLFPNPATTELHVGMDLPENQKVGIKLFNFSGSEVGTPYSAVAPLGNSDFTIDVRNLPAGIYFTEITLNGVLTSTRRFVVR